MAVEGRKFGVTWYVFLIILTLLHIPKTPWQRRYLSSALSREASRVGLPLLLPQVRRCKSCPHLYRKHTTTVHSLIAEQQDAFCMS